MPQIEYIKTVFVKPQKLTEVEYKHLKNSIKKNQNFEFVPVEKTSLDHSKVWKEILWMGSVGILLFVIGTLFMDGSNWLPLVMLPAVGLCFACILGMYRIMMESSSYENYKIEKKEYFERMKNTIIQTDNYDDFVRLFYIP